MPLLIGTAFIKERSLKLRIVPEARIDLPICLVAHSRNQIDEWHLGARMPGRSESTLLRKSELWEVENNGSLTITTLKKPLREVYQAQTALGNNEDQNG